MANRKAARTKFENTRKERDTHPVVLAKLKILLSYRQLYLTIPWEHLSFRGTGLLSIHKISAAKFCLAVIERIYVAQMSSDFLMKL